MGIEGVDVKTLLAVIAKGQVLRTGFIALRFSLHISLIPLSTNPSLCSRLGKFTSH